MASIHRTENEIAKRKADEKGKITEAAHSDFEREKYCRGMSEGDERASMNEPSGNESGARKLSV